MSQNAMEQRKAKPVSVCAHVSEEASHPSRIHVTESPLPILTPRLPASLARISRERVFHRILHLARLC